ncbi:MAG TPA: ATP-binding protein [Steroidobacteraceae bacterium]|nr:ATP-binding protein [Steroidobacteraceae bacterium]
MKDVRDEPTAAEQATTDLPLQAQLMGSLALVFVLSVVAGLVGYFTFDDTALENSVQAKAGVYASTLSSQIYNAIAADDPAFAEAVIGPLQTERNVYGVAVYGTRGQLLAGHGNFPRTLARKSDAKYDDDRVLFTVREVPIEQGVSGFLLLALSTEHIESARMRAAQFPAMTTAVVLLFAILLALAHSFSVMMSEVVRMFDERRQMERTEKARLERLVSERTRELERGREQFRLVVEGTQAIPFALDVEDGHFEYIGPQGPQRLGFGEELWKQIGFLDRLMPRERNSAIRHRIDETCSGNFEIETTVLTQDEKRVDLRWVASCEQSENTGQHKVLRGMMLDVTDQRRLENDLAQAQKLESVGRLAAGVAHEINTPVQFVADSVLFVREAMDDLSSIVDKYRELRSAMESGADLKAAARAAEEAEDEADLDYILENAPVALDRARDGLGRVANIVRSMKEFAHPDRKEKAQTDINQAIASTLVIASNEYKYVAEVETRFAELPLVNCFAGEINQVVLNLIVNAAHAIGDVVKDAQAGDMPRKGLITIGTRVVDGCVEIAIGDTGKGIPVEVRSRIFDPFFTTKEVGKGTGQGLAIARAVVVDKHGGTLHFETEVGRGTTFFIRLPLEASATASAAA